MTKKVRQQEGNDVRSGGQQAGRDIIRNITQTILSWNPLAQYDSDKLEDSLWRNKKLLSDKLKEIEHGACDLTPEEEKSIRMKSIEIEEIEKERSRRGLGFYHSSESIDHKIARAKKSGQQRRRRKKQIKIAFGIGGIILFVALAILWFFLPNNDNLVNDNLVIENATAESIKIAICYYDAAQKDWIITGWFMIEPSKKWSHRISTNAEYFYFYAAQNGKPFYPTEYDSGIETRPFWVRHEKLGYRARIVPESKSRIWPATFAKESFVKGVWKARLR